MRGCVNRSRPWPGVSQRYKPTLFRSHQGTQLVASTYIAYPTAITYSEPFSGTRIIKLFVQCANRSRLCVQNYNGSSWQWQDLGSP
jgi:hypothetical protein